MIFYILGMASGFEALFLLLPILVSLIYGESVLSSYLISCGICALFCGVSTLRKPKKITLYTKEGLVAVALVWIWFSVFGAVPFMLTGEIPNFFDAFFGGEFRFYNYRSQYSDQCRGTFTCQSVLEKFYPLGRRYGNSGLYPCFYSK